MLSKETHFRFKDTKRFQAKRQKRVYEQSLMEKIYYANSNQKKARAAILISDKIDFKTQNCYLRQRTFYNDKRISL